MLPIWPSHKYGIEIFFFSVNKTLDYDPELYWNRRDIRSKEARPLF
jgi:hypothetical protein